MENEGMKFFLAYVDCLYCSILWNVTRLLAKVAKDNHRIGALKSIDSRAIVEKFAALTFPFWRDERKIMTKKVYRRQANVYSKCF